MKITIDELIMEFTKLLIKQDLEDKRLGQAKMIKQVEMYKGIIKLLKIIRRSNENTTRNRKICNSNVK